MHDLGYEREHKGRTNDGFISTAVVLIEDPVSPARKTRDCVLRAKLAQPELIMVSPIGYACALPLISSRWRARVPAPTTAEEAA